MHPLVSILTPTQNRRIFIPWLIEMVKNQTYPQNRIEWIIADDGEEDLSDLVQDVPMIRYIQLKDKISIGSKRNLLASEASGEILVHFDDDDYYPPSRISHAVHRLVISKKLLAGANQLLMYNLFDSKISRLGPYGGPRHALGATMAYRKEYLLKNRFDDLAYKGEEKYFTNNFTNDMIQLDTLSTVICISHNKNTVPKDKVAQSPSDYKFVDIIQCEKAEAHYSSLAKTLLSNQ
jgi:glycosyltransferase involved in cell wall biosynthesis